MNIKSNQHNPVLLNSIITETKKLIDISNVFDGTFGGGGYSEYFLSHSLEVYACDLDSDAIKFYNIKNKPNSNLHLVKSNFSDYIQTFEDDYFDIIVADLGYSSNQLEFGKKGFSYLKKDEVFDLRYNTESGTSAYDKIRNLKNASDLGKIIYRYSGETFSNKIGQNLYEMTISNSGEVLNGQVTEIVEKSIPRKFIHKKNSILSRVWQAIRIWVNDEHLNLDIFLKNAVTKIKKNGLLMIISFNSLEDKIVTKFMREVSKKIEVDDFGNTIQYFEIITKKAIKPTETEVEENIRSRSAMLRILKKIK